MAAALKRKDKKRKRRVVANKRTRWLMRTPYGYEWYTSAEYTEAEIRKFTSTPVERV